MINTSVNLTNCDKEPIHIPGSIQNHGFLIAVEKSSFTICYASENLYSKTGITATDALQQPLEAFFIKASITASGTSLTQMLQYSGKVGYEKTNPISVTIQAITYYAITHETNDLLVLEFEPYSAGIETQLQSLIGISVSKIYEGKTLQSILQNTARQIKEIIQYDRVMIYRFWEDGHGEVVAEEKNEELEPFLGLHYPASDIPVQARELYKVNLIRIISDVHTATSPIVTTGKYAGKPLDLTHSSLRAVSPMHIEYLKNMGVAASFSVSLITDNKLWGLVACHNYSPLFIEYKARDAARLIGQILSSSLEYKDDEENNEAKEVYRFAADEMLREMQKNMEVSEAFDKMKEGLLQVTSASGVAILYEGNLYKTGQTPSNEEIASIVSWLSRNNNYRVFNTDSLSKAFASSKAFADTASGLLVCTLSKEMGEYILWFKPEIQKTIKWAGNPAKEIERDENGQLKLSPRKSFAAWSEQVAFTSAGWSKTEINTVVKLREDVMHIITQKANHIRQLNDKLKEAYEELDTFSFTISHDLKTPITSIKNYTQLLLRDDQNFGSAEVDILKRILKSTDKMTVMINEVLNYSKISRTALAREPINIQALVQEIVLELRVAYKLDNTVFVVKELPTIYADKVMIAQVFSNILSNAVKYSARSEKPLVTVEAAYKDGENIFKITDNGIGIDMKYGSNIYEVFKRMDNVKQFEGSGVGLSIVKRIMEKHNAKIWYESVINSGTTFYLSFNN